VPHPKDPSRPVTVRYELRPDRAALLLRIYEVARDGLGNWRLTEHLQTNHEPWDGTSWTPTRVNWLLNAREVLGEFQPIKRDEAGKRLPDGPRIPGYYPRAIADDLFDSVRGANTLTGLSDFR
jgi:hypothetical protein